MRGDDEQSGELTLELAPRVRGLWHYRVLTGGHGVLCSLLIASLSLAAGPVVARDQDSIR